LAISINISILNIDYKKLTEVKAPIIFVAEGQYDREKAKKLQDDGVEINIIKIRKEEDDGNRFLLDIPQILSTLKFKYNIRSVMVEGGAQVIRSFLIHSVYVQRIIITIGPFFIGHGVKALGDLENTELSTNNLPRLCNTQSIILGQDIIVIGYPNLS